MSEKRSLSSKTYLALQGSDISYTIIIGVVFPLLPANIIFYPQFP
jgi:hypothetical protein